MKFPWFSKKPVEQFIAENTDTIIPQTVRFGTADWKMFTSGCSTIAFSDAIFYIADGNMIDSVKNPLKPKRICNTVNDLYFNPMTETVYSLRKVNHGVIEVKLNYGPEGYTYVFGLEIHAEIQSPTLELLQRMTNSVWKNYDYAAQLIRILQTALNHGVTPLTSAGPTGQPINTTFGITDYDYGRFIKDLFNCDQVKEALHYQTAYKQPVVRIRYVKSNDPKAPELKDIG